MTREERLEELYPLYEEQLIHSFTEIKKGLPGVDTSDFLPTDSDFDLFYNSPEKTYKLQKKITAERMEVVRSRLESQFNEDGDAADRMAFKVAEQGNLVPLSTFPSTSRRRIPDPDFVAMTRARFQLPRKLQYDLVERPGTDFDMDECVACPDKLIDAHSNHPQSCPTAYRARNARHNYVNQVVYEYGRKAGFTASKEVPVADLLAQELPVEDMDRIVKRKSRDGDQRRMDCVLTDGNATLWVDVTVRHPTCESNLQREVNQPGATLRSAVKEKWDTYGGLVRTAREEADDKQRQHAPKFFPAAMDTFGRFGVEFKSLIETIVKRRKLEISREPPRMDGRSPKWVADRFRADFGTDLIIAMARGNARMILRSGRPRGFLRARWRRV